LKAQTVTGNSLIERQGGGLTKGGDKHQRTPGQKRRKRLIFTEHLKKLRAVRVWVSSFINAKFVNGNSQ